jgi:hypothetical protein
MWEVTVQGALNVAVCFPTSPQSLHSVHRELIQVRAVPCRLLAVCVWTAGGTIFGWMARCFVAQMFLACLLVCSEQRESDLITSIPFLLTFSSTFLIASSLSLLFLTVTEHEIVLLGLSLFRKDFRNPMAVIA